MAATTVSPSCCRVAPTPRFQCPRQESNLVFDLRRVACDPQHSENKHSFSAPPRNRTSSNRFVVCRACPVHLQGNCLDQESDLDLDLRRVPCHPLHYRDERADDWIRASIVRFTRPLPFSVEPRRHFYLRHTACAGYVQQECKDSNPVERLWRPHPLPGGHSCKAKVAGTLRVPSAAATARRSVPATTFGTRRVPDTLSRSARIRNLSSGFGDRVLSQEDTPTQR